MNRFTLALGIALYVIEACVATAVLATSDQLESPWVTIGLGVGAGAAFVFSGLVALVRRPENRTGVYLAATGYVWFIAALSESDSDWVFTIGFIFGNLVWAPFTALVLAYPTGRLETRLERAIPIATAILLVVPAFLAALLDPSPAVYCDECAGSAIAIAETDVGGALDLSSTLAGLGLIGLIVVILVRRWRRATRALRRLLWPVVGAGIATLLAVGLVVIANQISHTASDWLSLLFFACFATVPLAFLFGILRTRLALSAVSNLVVDLDRGAPIRDALAGALGDPSLEIVYPLDSGWVDELGHDAERTVGRPGTTLTPVEAEGKVVAALVHDASLSEDPALLDGVAHAAALALHTQGLQAETRAQLAFLRTLVETAPSLFIHIGTDGRVRNQNAAAVEAAGLDDEELVRGRYFWDVFIDPDERDDVIARFHALAPDFETGEYENTFVNARGERRVVFWRSAPVHNEAGKVTGIISAGIDITERRLRELELERERDATTTALESTPSIMVVLDRAGTIRDRDVDNPRVGANRAFRQSLGWRDDELVGRPFLELVVADDGPAAAALAAAAAGGASEEVESELRCADGSIRAFSWSAVPVADVTGREEALVLVSGMEVTERRRLEAEKERERAFLNAIANNAPSLLCLIDHEGRLTHMGANIAFERALEYEPEELGGQLFWEEFVVEAEAHEVRRLVEQVVAGDIPREHDNTWRTKSGRPLSIAWTCTPLPRLDERTLFLITGVDVTERRRREEEIRAGEERLRAVIESAPVAIAEIGLDDTVRLWNPAAERIFGWSPDEVVGRPPRWVPDDLQHEFRALSAREAAGSGYTGFETVRLHRDGRRLRVEISAAPIRDASGAVVGAMAVMTDISDRKRQEEELRASRVRLVEAADEARQQLERNLHDGAQQRLVALSVALRLVESKISADPATASSILDGAREELSHALEELRELARGIHPAVLTDRGLAPAVEALVSRAPVPVEVDVSPDRFPAAVEAASYYVVAEALTNVAKYARATEASVQVVREDGRVVVEVRDDGAGGADPAQGSGLRGLADRVAALDGVLVVGSPVGKGTTVRAEIPFLDVAQK